MKSHPRLSQLLVETKAFTDLEKPVILASGQLGIYYVNAEKLVQDGGKFNDYGNSSLDIIQHAVRMTQQHPTFGEVISILAQQTKELLSEKFKAVSGGQRRDWLFSGPVARNLGIPHISIYKDRKSEAVYPDGRVCPINYEGPLNGMYIVHIVDLLTEGSSCYSSSDGVKSGWIPEIRKRGGRIDNLVAVVTRLQKGEENLLAQGVTVHANVAIDEDFLRQHSNNPERALDYVQNPKNWSENYLRQNGALSLIETFNPQGGKLDRARKFLDGYGNALAKADRWDELDREVNSRYGVHLGNISGDVD
ncbi:hypothetical protein A3K73_06095 [Candidatus Pacearchaeota archaeon RBG_13_36_9]|nr:MAG: hypothetical protein A3K73_06095 [Candidatus Pacearchaeota archaeon RBG_13_36_9]